MIETVINKFRLWKRSHDGLVRRVKELEQRLFTLEAQLTSPVYKSLALTENPLSPMSVLDWRGVGIVTAITAVPPEGGSTDPDYILARLAEPNGSKNWQYSTEESTVYTIAAVGHSFQPDDVIVFHWEGTLSNGQPVYRAIQATSGTTATIYTVSSNAASAGQYNCTPGPVVVTHWQEFALGLTGHRLLAGNTLLGFTISGTRYGISGGAYGTS